MDPPTILQSVELFEGLTSEELRALAELCHERLFAEGEVITRQGEPGEELYIVHEGFVEVVRNAETSERAPRTVVHLSLIHI